MRRYLIAVAVVGLLGALSASDAQACHKKKCAAPTACVEPCPPPPPPVCVPCPPKKKCHFKMPKFGGLCHKKPACAPAPCPVAYESAPVYAAPQGSPQGSPQAYASGQ